MRLGYVRFVGEYIADLDNAPMVEHALDYLEEDIKEAVKNGTLRKLLDGYPDAVMALKEDNISDCCQEFIKKPKKVKR
jgi:hypothetical protein